MAEITEERIAKVVRAGEDAFWETVAAQFPEAETGDLAPDMSHQLILAMERAVRAWANANTAGESAGLASS